MKLDVIQERLQEYTIRSKVDEENAFKEISQEIALAGLARAKFFNLAAFQGGTCLRIIHGLKRFSEDLDFILMKPDLDFQWEPFLKAITVEFHSFGLSLEALDRSKASDPVKKAFLKEDSFGQVLKLKYLRNRSNVQKVVIKLEIDTNPPKESNFETHFLAYPYSFSLATQDQPSLFAGKCHALLCRQYEKGRDWFDFLWYIQKKIKLNQHFLKNALKQCGPYQETDIPMSNEWILEELQKKIQTVNWTRVINDVEKFVRAEQFESLQLWNADFFEYHRLKLVEILGTVNK